MEVEARDIKRPVAIMTIGRFEVAEAMEGGRIPGATAEVGQQRQAGPQLSNLLHEQRVVVDGAEGIVERLLPLLHGSAQLVDAIHLHRHLISISNYDTPSRCFSTSVCVCVWNLGFSTLFADFCPTLSAHRFPANLQP